MNKKGTLKYLKGVYEEEWVFDNNPTELIIEDIKIYKRENILFAMFRFKDKDLEHLFLDDIKESLVGNLIKDKGPRMVVENKIYSIGNLVNYGRCPYCEKYYMVCNSKIVQLP